LGADLRKAFLVGTNLSGAALVGARIDVGAFADALTAGAALIEQ
jgi:uncharacterized protein YjbI with pentapeptide repeats